eukprot:2391491-Pleurochrysis_carterae.AAC.2
MGGWWIRIVAHPRINSTHMASLSNTLHSYAMSMAVSSYRTWYVPLKLKACLPRAGASPSIDLYVA